MKAMFNAGAPLNRRRFMVLAGAAGIVPFMPGSGHAHPELELVKWHGAALGAEASIQLYHTDAKWARRQLLRCQQEITRLESLFSLYRQNSEISQLNRTGVLKNPSVEFLTVMSQAMAFSKTSQGVFDVTVQPLWHLYASHFTQTAADPAGPSEAEISRVLHLVGSDKIILDAGEVRFAKAGMGVTLNGIAQGFITDRITHILKSAGFENVLVSLGENYAIGTKPDGMDWSAGIISPVDGRSIAQTVSLKDKALATSGGYGSPFSPHTTSNHLLNPKTGKTADIEHSVSVIAKTATIADMVSTALCLMTKGEGETLVQKIEGIDQVIYI